MSSTYEPFRLLTSLFDLSCECSSFINLPFSCSFRSGFNPIFLKKLENKEQVYIKSLSQNFLLICLHWGLNSDIRYFTPMLSPFELSRLSLSACSLRSFSMVRLSFLFTITQKRKGKVKKTWKQWNLETMKLRNNETWKQWNLETMKLGNNETWKQWNLETMRIELMRMLCKSIILPAILYSRYCWSFLSFLNYFDHLLITYESYSFIRVSLIKEEARNMLLINRLSIYLASAHPW